MIVKLIRFNITLLLLVMLFGATIQNTFAQTPGETTYEGVVTSIKKDTQTEQTIELRLTSGSRTGELITIDNEILPTVNNPVYKIGDKVMVTEVKDYEGNYNYYITDYVRRGPLIFLALLFVAATVIVGGVWGIASIVGMIFSFLIIIFFILPSILTGHNPVIIAILGACAIIPVTFYLSHGFHTKTHVAIVGTLITLVLVGSLSVIFVELAHLTGFSTEEASFLQTELPDQIDIKGLLLAGIIISSLGILDDITVSQSSIVRELKEANRKLSSTELFKRAMRVGRDHISSLVNTLILVYTGASLPLILLFTTNPRGISETLNYEIVAEEVVRTLIGSIGLILAVPITTAIAAYYFSRKKAVLQ